jgi:hypothetical protein
MQALISFTGSMAKSMESIFLQVFAAYAVLAVGTVAAVAFVARQLWRFHPAVARQR